jgi:serine/threonine-protein kinase
MPFGQRYQPIAMLGEGGMGSVYLARDDSLDELVAVKMLQPELVGNLAMVERFREEVRLARRVSSPFVARTHDLGEHRGRFFVTMQYVEGETLSSKIKRDGRLSPSDVVSIARDVCRGLEAVHEAGVVHRDLKPANVLIAAHDGRAVLTDFGIAVRAGASEEHVDRSGTPTYAAPEQLLGATLDARTDVFAFGAMLYVMLTGQRPFPAPRTGREDPPDPRRIAGDVPDALASIVMRATALDPAERYESVASLHAALDDVHTASAAAKPSKLTQLVRSVCAGTTRRLMLSLELVGLEGAFAGALRADFTSRLEAAGAVRVVADGGEAALDGRVVVKEGACAFELAMKSVGDGYVFWSDAITGPFATLPQLVDRAAHAVQRALVPSTKAVRTEDSLPSEEVARLFLEGRAEYRAFWGSHLTRSIEIFERARALAPEHPLIVAWCAAAHGRLRYFASSSDQDLGRELALRAVALAPDMAEARMALATVHMVDMHVALALPHIVEAVRLAPGLVEQRSLCARLLAECGALEPARMLAESALEIDPTFIEPLEVFMRPLALRGHLDRAAKYTARFGSPRDSYLRVVFARYCLWNRDRAAFQAECESFDWNALDAQPRLGLELCRATLDGESPPLDRVAMEATGTARRRALVLQMIAEVHAFRHDDRRALDSIESAVTLGMFDVQWMDLCPLLDPMRGTLRFEAMRRTVHERAYAALAEIERCL